MMKLTVSDKCDECERCEVFLPGLLDRISGGAININENNTGVDWVKIHKAINVCPLGAIKLK